MVNNEKWMKKTLKYSKFYDIKLKCWNIRLLILDFNKL